MSVPVPQRGHGELEVNSKARALTVYTLKILENEKWFPKEQSAFITKLQDCTIEIQALCWDANNIKVDGNPDRYRRRIDHQDRAAEMCNRMMMLIETAKPLFHLESKRVRKKYRRLVAKAKRGECTRESVDSSWATWINHLSKGNTYKLIQRLNRYYKELWEGKPNVSEKTGIESSGSG